VDRIVSARVEAQRWYVRFPRAVPVGIFLLTMAITTLSVFAIERVEAERRNGELREVSVSLTSALMRRAAGHVSYLRAASVRFANGEPVTEAAFREAAQDVQANQEFHSPDGITWVERVARDRIPAFEARRRAEGAAGFTVHPAVPPGRDHALPITYFSQPSPRGNRALGYDLASLPDRQKVLRQAERLHAPVATGRVAAPPTAGGGAAAGNWVGFAVYIPIFVQGRLAGYVSAPFSGEAFLRSALVLEQARGFGVRFYDDHVAPDRLIAAVEPRLRTDQALARPLDIAGHRFVLEVTTLRTATLSPLSMVTLLFGIMVATLLTIMARLLTSQAEEDRTSLEWLREQASIRNSLTRELNHRVKNTLANVLSIIALTSRRATDLPSFVESLNGRIRALSATHDLLTDLDWGPTPLRSVVSMELAPYTAGRDHHIMLEGEDVLLAPNDALSLGLAMHELMTNATKYGALSVASGRISVVWKPLSPSLVEVRWCETGGPPVAQDRRRGFGTDLIERIVAQELGGGVDLRFDPEGVSCTLVVPVRQPAVFQIRAAK